jgi:16S rRNA (uracil1498-N3)-methyltransferase
MNLFYFPELTIPKDSSTWVIDFPVEEAKHAIKVLRLSLDSQVSITNGLGLMAYAHIIAINKKQCVAQVERFEEEYGKRNHYLHIAVAPTKNIKRFEWFLEKATEMGIDEITPVIGFHSERREIKYDRENKVITAAMKQSLKAYHPKLNQPMAIKEFIKSRVEEELYIAHLIDDKQLLLKNAYHLGKSVCVLIGPEGDFSHEEVLLALESGFDAVSLGNTRLRTETAALASCFTINMLNL